jgi:MFS family permease/quinol monooxygenase YgiN
VTEGAVAQSPWAPLRVSAFRALWLASLVGNIGTWMQTVAAQWLLVHEPNASTLVALVQTASTLPIVLLALPSGVLADTLDRRQLLIVVQLFQGAVAAGLTVLTVAGQVTPALLLTFTFALGAGAALTNPAYQAIIPGLVPREELHAASALGSVNINVARAVGPALAGVLVAWVGPATVFALNAASFLAFALVLAAWSHQVEPSAHPPERFVPALRAGGRYVRHSPVTRRILGHQAGFVVPAIALWALLPLVADRRLQTGPGGYGALLAGLGIGAVAGVLWLPRIRALCSINAMLVGAELAYAVALVVLVTVRSPVVAVVVLLPAGAAWVVVLASLNAAVQLFLPGWVRARGLSAYLIVQAAGQAVGALVWGLLAEDLGLVHAYLAAAGLLVAAALMVLARPLIDVQGLDRSPAVYWPEPDLELEPEPHAGPVLVQSTYAVAPDKHEAFREAMEDVRRSRMRTGATRWELYQEGEDPDRFVELYTVPSWDEHLRQHGGRLTGSDQVAELRALALSEPPPVVVHLFPADEV